MTGNSPENEAGIDGQESRTEDYYETEIRDMARQKHSGETVISCYKREKKIERGRGGLLTRMKSQRDKEIETETTQKTKEETETQQTNKKTVFIFCHFCSLGTSRFVWDTNICCGTLCFVGGHHVFVWDTNIFFRDTMFCLGDKSLLWDIEFCWRITIFCLGHKYLLWDIVFC